MCEQANKLIFCSCEPKPAPIVHNKNSRRAKNQPTAPPAIVWSLSRYVGEEAIAMEGLMMEPSQQLGQLSAEFILQQLNSRQCFDFDYQPQELDQLSIYQPAVGRMLLLYKQACWRLDSHGWAVISQPIGKGTLKLE